MYMKPQTCDPSDVAPPLMLADCLRVLNHIEHSKRDKPTLMHRDDVEKFDRIFAEFDFMPEHYAVICSAVRLNIYGDVAPSGFIEPPTARQILRAVFTEDAMRHKLKLIWGLTLNKVFERVEPVYPQITDSGNEHDPLDDHYNVADAIIDYLDDESEHGIALNALPIKRRVVCNDQIGYDHVSRMPVRIDLADENLTKHEWETMLSVLDKYVLVSVHGMFFELRTIWRGYLKDGTLPTSISMHPVYGMAVVGTTISAWRLYLIMYTIKFNFYKRSYPGWQFFIPDDK